MKLQKMAVNRHLLMPLTSANMTDIPHQVDLSLTPADRVLLILRNTRRHLRLLQLRMISVQGSIEVLLLLRRFRRQIARQSPLVLRLRQRKAQSIHTLPRVPAQIELRVLSLRM